MIEYFSEEVYNPDPNDSSQAIPYTVTKSIVFILSGSIFVVVGYVFCILGQCMDRKSRFTLLSGVIFIQTGLAMLCGLIMYIAVFKAEVGSKLRPRSHLQPPAFSYSYGYSFCTYVAGVVAAKLTGVSGVFLYLHRARYEWHRRRLEPPPPFRRCERHPHAYVDTNSWLQRRPCSVHRDVVPFPAEGHVKVHGGLPRDRTADTVCTTLGHLDGGCSPESGFVAFDLDAPAHLAWTSERSLHEVDALRRTTPV